MDAQPQSLAILTISLYLAEIPVRYSIASARILSGSPSTAAFQSFIARLRWIMSAA